MVRIMKLKDLYLIVLIFNLFFWVHHFGIFSEISFEIQFGERQQQSQKQEQQQQLKHDSADANSNKKMKAEEMIRALQKAPKKNKITQELDPLCKNNSNYTQTSLKIDPKIIEFKLQYEPLCFDSEPLVFVYIFNKAMSFDKRKLIRQTWGDIRRFPRIRIAFILGLSKDEKINTKIIKESEVYKDIIQSTFIVN